MIRFGPAGIPLSCKGRTLKDGVEDVHNLSLSALEIQMVRAGVERRYPFDEELGLTLGEVVDSFAVEAYRDDEVLPADEPLDEGDELVCLPSGITGHFGELDEVGRMARRLDVSLSVHTPYYIDLGSGGELTEACMDSIRYAGLIADALGGGVVATSLGLYTGRMPEEEADANILENVAALMDWWQDAGLRPKLGIDITGQPSVFGSLDQVLDLCTEVDGLIPVMDFPRHHSRTGGSLVEIEDFEDLIRQIEPYYGDGPMYMKFSGVEHADGSERRLTPIKKGDLRFEPLAEALCEIQPEASVISCSPLLEHDAMYMRLINERVLSRRVTKDLKEKRRAEAAAASEE
jgi:deoxyribonuclease-4